MRGGSGVKTSWPVIAIAFAVIGVPMGVAVIQDLGSDTDEEDLLARIGQVNDIAADEDEEDEAGLEEADDIAGRWHEPAMDQAFFDEVFLGGPDETKPALRGPLADVEWKMAPAVAPDLSRWPRARVRLLAYGTPFANEMVVGFPDDGTAARVLASRWGEPQRTIGADNLARSIWTNRELHLRVVLESHDGNAQATFSPYMPVSDYVAQNGGFAFEHHPILGASPELLAMKYAGDFNPDPGESTGQIACPGVELSEHPATCTVSFVAGKAVLLTVTVDHSLAPQAGPEVFAALRDALGPVRDQVSDDYENRWTFDGGYTVTQRVGEPTITIVRVAR
jgi:hypothetical protein